MAGLGFFGSWWHFVFAKRYCLAAKEMSIAAMRQRPALSKPDSPPEPSHRGWPRLRRRLWPGLAAWAERLEETAGGLGGLASEIEGEVLELGRKLEEFSRAARGASEQAAGAAEALKGSGEMARASELFASAFGSLSECNGKIGAGLERLEAIGGRLESLLRYQRPLGHVIRTVRMLRVATRMETARLEDEEEDLAMLADEIDRFSRRMDSYVAGFFEQAAGVATETARLVARLSEERREYERRLDRTQGATQAALEQIRAILAQAADLSGLSARRTGQVVAEVSDIVASLQFHDITRQQLEHVQRALGEAAAKLRGNRYLGLGALRQRSLVVRVLALQGSQLQQAKAGISGAGERVSASLRGIAETCQAQSIDLASLLGQEASGQGLGELEKQMAVLAEVLEQGSRLSDQMLKATQAAAALLQKMESGLAAIQSINDDLGLLALNAVVRVSSHAEKGRALAEVAGGVNRLSEQPRDTISQAASEVKALLAEARELTTTQEATLSATRQQAEGLAGEAAAALAGLRRLGREVKGLVADLAAESEGLVSEISAVARSVRFAEVVAARTQEAIALLEGCQCALGAERAAAAEPEPDRLKALESKYTMESERQVHRKVIRQAAAAPEASAASPAPGESEELGDNVELF